MPVLANLWLASRQFLRESGERLCGSQTLRKSHKRAMLSWATPKQGVLLHGLWKYRGHRREFSEAASRKKALCNLEKPQVDCSSLSTGRKHCLKISGMRQVLGSHTQLDYVFKINKYVKNCFFFIWGMGDSSQVRHFLNFWHTKPESFLITALYMFLSSSCSTCTQYKITVLWFTTWCHPKYQKNTMRLAA